MYPVLLTVFGFSITSFGVFLIIAIISALFVLWRLAKVFELDQEKILDLFFISVIGGLIGARIWYIFFHLDQFQSITKMFFFFKYSGLAFWGALVAIILSVRLFAPKLKLNYWQAADLAIVAGFLAISIISFGCLLGGCQYGHSYDGFFAIHTFGLNGTQFPLQIIESGLFILGFIYLWNALLRFHFNGKIVAVGLIILGLIKLLLQPFRGDASYSIGMFSLGIVMSLLFLAIGTGIFYLQSKRSFLTDLKFTISLVHNKHRRKFVISKLRRVWYNFFVELQIGLKNYRKNFKKQFRLKSTPRNI